MSLKTRILMTQAAFLVAAAAWTGATGVTLADNEDLKCTAAEQSSWMSEDAAKDLLTKQGYKEVRSIEATDGRCYEVYAVDSLGEKVELYLDPTNGNIVAKED